jgi:hypothetical protein
VEELRPSVHLLVTASENRESWRSSDVRIDVVLMASVARTILEPMAG